MMKLINKPGQLRKFLHLLGKSKKMYESNYLKSTEQILNSMLIKKKGFFQLFFPFK